MIDKKEYNRQYYLKHKEKIKRYARERGRKYYQQHRDKKLEYAKEYKHRSRTPEKAGRYYQTHKEEIKKYNFQHRKVRSAMRRCRVKNAGKLTIQTIQEVYDKNIITNGGVLRCVYCGKELTNKEATLEHKQPLSRGGTNEKENLAIACRDCNCSKYNKTVEEFRGYLIKKEEK